MTTTLLRNGMVHTGLGPAGTALAVADGRVAFVGDDDAASSYDGADEVVDLHGALVTPAFVDAHLHLVSTGQQLTGLDLTEAASLDDALARIAAHVVSLSADAVVVGGRWDETTWPERAHPTADDLERIAPGRRIYLSRIDGHSAIVSRALLAETPAARGQPGYADDGRLERTAKHTVSDHLGTLIGPSQRLAGARAAARGLAGLGVGAFHETSAPHIGPESELAVVRQAAAEVGLRATLYWGELGAFGKAMPLGIAGLAGDLNADGAVGSRTAALHEEYADVPGHCGHGYLDAAQVADHVVGCTERGLQAGFHCIGDAALDAVTEGFRLAAGKLGTEAVRAQRHRLEHCEMPSAETIAMMAELGVTASVQPMFDGLWGGPDRMYAERLGERWRQLNPFRALADAGVTLAFGSDSPVTTPEPWQAVRAAAYHHNPDQRISVLDAFRAHTRGGWLAARIDDAGTLTPGAPAAYAVWETPGGTVDGLPDLAPGVPLPQCLRTVVDGRTVFEGER